MTLVGTLKNIAYISLFIILTPLIPLIVGSIQAAYNRYVDPRAQVAVIPVKGVLYDSAYHIKHLHNYFKDDQIKAILLKIECPGSACGTGQAIFNEIMMLKKEYPKPVIAITENMCASGGYYIACAADHIIASPMALVGSIGVTCPYFFQLKDFVEQFKIKHVPLAAGTYKNTTNPFTQMTPEQQKMMQSVLDDEYEQFVEDVCKGRNLCPADAAIYGDGKILSGRQALKAGLVDELGSHSQAVAKVKEMANIGTDVKWIWPPSKSGFWAFFGSSDDETQSTLSICLHELCAVIESRYSNTLLH